MSGHEPTGQPAPTAGPAPAVPDPCADSRPHPAHDHYRAWPPGNGDPGPVRYCPGVEYRGPRCSHPHNLPYNDECAVWWLRGTPAWAEAHTNLGGGAS